jgi:dihydroxy-acid dehydratase
VNDAGGVPALMKALGSRIHKEALSVSGMMVGDIVAAAEIKRPEIIKTDADPVETEGSIFILKGTLAPGGGRACARQDRSRFDRRRVR